MPFDGDSSTRSAWQTDKCDSKMYGCIDDFRWQRSINPLKKLHSSCSTCKRENKIHFFRCAIVLFVTCWLIVRVCRNGCIVTVRHVIKRQHPHRLVASLECQNSKERQSFQLLHVFTDLSIIDGNLIRQKVNEPQYAALSYYYNVTHHTLIYIKLSRTYFHS